MSLTSVKSDKSEGQDAPSIAGRDFAANIVAVSCPACGHDNYKVHAVVDSSFRFCRCLGCRTIYQNPRLNESGIQSQYGAGYFATNNVCSGYLNYAHTSEQQRKTAAWLWKQVRSFSGGMPQRVLDVGCGSGAFLNEGIRRNLECWGIDFYLPSAEPRYRFVRGDFARADLPAKFFDLVVFHDSFEHFPEPNLPLRRCEEILQPGGHILVNTPDPDSWLARISGSSWISLKHEHLVIYPRRILAGLLQQHHFLNPIRVASRQYANWSYLKPRLQRLSPALARVMNWLCASVAEKPFLVPTGGMIMIARHTNAKS
ncbi:MAG TPA: class I SAM-dependent methyltransferase [Acidobacteriota bacterium]